MMLFIRGFQGPEQRKKPYSTVFPSARTQFEYPTHFNPFIRSMFKKINRYPFRNLVIVLLIFNALISCSRKSEFTPAAVAAYLERHNQPYGSDSLQRYDLFLPQGRNQQTKMVIVIHGGGWVSGEKEFVNSFAKRFSDFGYAAVSMNYRFANDSVHYHEMLDDIDSVVACVSRNSVEWGIMKGYLAIFGYSAGGHLALLYAYSRNRNRNIRSVISLAGPADIQDSALRESQALYAEIGLMTGDTLPANWTLANPTHFITPTAPPTFLIHGTADTVVPVSQAVKLDQKLKASYAPVNLFLMEGQTHLFTLDATEIFLENTKTFLDATLK